MNWKKMVVRACVVLALAGCASWESVTKAVAEMPAGCSIAVAAPTDHGYIGVTATHHCTVKTSRQVISHHLQVDAGPFWYETSTAACEEDGVGPDPFAHIDWWTCGSALPYHGCAWYRDRAHSSITTVYGTYETDTYSDDPGQNGVYWGKTLICR